MQYITLLTQSVSNMAAFYLIICINQALRIRVILKNAKKCFVLFLEHKSNKKLLRCNTFKMIQKLIQNFQTLQVPPEL